METEEDIITDIISGAADESIDETLTEDTDTVEEVEQIEGTLPAAESEADPIDDITIPEDWEEPIKNFFGNELFAKDIEAKKAFFDKFKNLNDGYQGKFNELSEQRKMFEGEKGSFEDNRGLVQTYKALEEQARAVDGELFNREISRMGGTNQYFQSLHQVNSMMEKNPLETISKLCGAYNITPQDIANGVNDPTYQARQQQSQQATSMASMKEQITQQIREEALAERAKAEAESLFTAVDVDGSLKYPKLADVQQDVGMIMQAKQVDFEKAYSLARAMNPDIFADENAQAAKAASIQDENDRARVVKQPKASPKASNASRTDLSEADVIANIMRENGMEPIE